MATIDADMLWHVQASIPRCLDACYEYVVDTLNTYFDCCPLIYTFICCVLCWQTPYTPQVLLILICVNCTFFFCTLIFIISLVHECHLQFLCGYSTLHVSASVSQHRHQGQILTSRVPMLCQVYETLKFGIKICYSDNR